MVTVDWPETAKGLNVVWKVPRNIRMNDNIVVKEDEIAVFYRDGKALSYLDRPDRYALTSLDIPAISTLVERLTGVKQDAEVYYIQKKPFDAKFGSRQPYQFKDADFGFVNLRLFGEFRWRVKDPSNFISRFVGTMGATTPQQIEERLREQVVAVVFDGLGEMKKRGLAVVDLAANLLEIEQVTLEKAKPHFDPYGIEIQKLSGLTISLPEEVQKAVDARASMGILGTNYMQYQTGQAMRDAASNPSGGAAATGVGVGAGMAMGWQMAGAMQQPPPGYQQAPQGYQTQTAPPPPAPPAGAPCPKCGQPNAPGTKFCGNCGTNLLGSACPNCKTTVPPGVKFCGNCGTKMP
jgi:membrane protease subunit (stomatin/prohibitin family)